ncbi:MAG: flagellar hook-associated protein FlgK [Clostridiaceae bacterium]|jgi:flagellar hook-associated protein 1 FlgK|nr:flagellar hook-associated protein FlgK [Clostridiaceae bacterium]
MGEAFFGLNVAVRGLFSAQRSLDIVNHNLNNVNTPGYSRQQAIQVASRPMALADGTGMLGTGSEVIGVTRIRDEYLDFKYWSEAMSYGEWGVKREILSDLEILFNEPSDSGFTAIMSNFFDSLQELAKDPGSAAVRSLVRQNAVTLTRFFNNLATKLEEMQYDINHRIQTKVEEINSLALQIQQLNRQIYITELSENTANDMRDQRTVLVDKLSKLINIEAYEVVVGYTPDGREDKHFVITVSGKALVDHFTVSTLALEQRDAGKKVNREDIPGLYEVKWADGNKLNVKGGELKGLLDMRDGNEGSVNPDNGLVSPNYKGIPYYIKKLNEFVRIFARAFNEGYIDLDGDRGFDADEFGTGHASGYGHNSDLSGIRFFTMTGESRQPLSTSDFLDGASEPEDIYDVYEKITAKNFSVSADILDDYNLIAASDEAGQASNINVLNALLALRRNADMFSEGAPEDFMKSLVTTMGIDSQQAGNYSDNQKIVIDQIVNRRLSYSGVSIDEEMANLVKFQHAYNAAAKMIQTISEIYETLINELFV